MKLKCKCGHVISTVTCPCPVEGRICGDGAKEESDDKIAATIAAFINAIQKDHREEWIANWFGSDYPTDLENASVVSDIITYVGLPYLINILERESCGSVHIQDGPGSETFRMFSAVDQEYGALLRQRTAEPRPGG